MRWSLNASAFLLVALTASPAAAQSASPTESPLRTVTDQDRARVISFSAAPEATLLSGWVLEPERAAGRPPLVDVPLGRGHVIVFAVRPQYRAHSIATFPLFYNALKR